MFSIKRDVYSKKEATLLEIDKGVSDAYALTNRDLDSFIKVNSYPCNTGLIVTADSIGLAFSLSHSVTCHFMEENEFEIIISRNIEHIDMKGVNEYLEDLNYTRIDMNIELS
jgi:hypothetical protein